ncbi:MAG: hypothetical protein A3F16_06885 [Deltaproteobacteria bacterium RIFCSPHIGHO2_12_FULL_43_9]|nr:MAG: hypothetical protein A3F16_06885 [Deltaproteobacteria bacterium RIFCSPHIGHO2_12_FULL_43_9]
MNTLVYMLNSPMPFKRKGLLISWLTLASILLFSSLLLTGCGQGTDDEEDEDEFNSEDIPTNIRKSKQPTAKDLFGGPREAQSDDPSGKNIVRETPALKAWNKAEELIDYSERNPEYLNKAAKLLKTLLKTVENVSKAECQGSVNDKDFILGPCNQHAEILSKISQVYYFKAELIEPDDAFQDKIDLFKKGIEIAEEAKEYNKHNIDVQLWYANNKGGWLSTMDALYPGDPAKWYNLSEGEINELSSAPRKIIGALKYALSLGRRSGDSDCISNNEDKDDLGEVYVSLGHAYHKLPTDMIGFASKEDKLTEAKNCLRKADALAAGKVDKTSYAVHGNKLQMPKFYLFALYSDDEKGTFSIPHAKHYAKNVKRIILNKNFRRKYPTTTRREMNGTAAEKHKDGILTFEQQYGQ